MVPRGLVFVVLFQPEPQLPGVFVVALLTHRLEVDLVELGLDGHLLVARRTREVVHAPGLIQSGEHVARNDLVANVAQVAEELVVVGLAVGQSFALVMAVAVERFLAFGAHEMLRMPVFA